MTSPLYILASLKSTESSTTAKGNTDVVLEKTEAAVQPATVDKAASRDFGKMVIDCLTPRKGDPALTPLS